MADDTSASMVLNAEERRRLEHSSASAAIKVAAFGAGTAATLALGAGIWRYVARLTAPRGGYDSVTIISCSEAKLVFENDLAVQSKILEVIITGRCARLPVWSAFTTETLQKVMAYFRKHAVSAGGATVDLESFDQAFVCMNFRSLFEVYLAAEYFEINPLRKIAKAALKLMLVMKTDDEVGDLFKSK